MGTRRESVRLGGGAEEQGEAPGLQGAGRAAGGTDRGLRARQRRRSDCDCGPGAAGNRRHQDLPPEGTDPCGEARSKWEDETFDRTFDVAGPVRLVRALLNANVRRLLLRESAKGGLEIVQGELRVATFDRNINDLVPTLLKMGRRFAQAQDTVGLLADHARRRSQTACACLERLGHSPGAAAGTLKSWRKCWRRDEGELAPRPWPWEPPGAVPPRAARCFWRSSRGARKISGWPRRPRWAGVGSAAAVLPLEGSGRALGSQPRSPQNRPASGRRDSNPASRAPRPASSPWPPAGGPAVIGARGRGKLSLAAEAAPALRE